MDEKTLEYMGSRVDAARKLTAKIVALRKDREYLNQYSVDSITFGNRNYLYTVEHYRKEVSAAVIGCIEAALAAAEQKLAEL